MLHSEDKASPPNRFWPPAKNELFDQNKRTISGSLFCVYKVLKLVQCLSTITNGKKMKWLTPLVQFPKMDPEAAVELLAFELFLSRGCKLAPP